jgi:hypothetical protein
MFIIGGVGTMLLSIFSFIYWMLYFLWYNGILPIPSDPFWLMMTIIALLVAIFGVLAGLGLLAYRKAYGSIFALISFIFTMIFIWFIFISDVMTLFPFSIIIWSLLLTLDALIWIIGYFFLGLILLFWSITFITTAGKTGTKVLSIISAVFLMIAGIMYMLTISVIWWSFAWPLDLWGLFLVIQPGAIMLLIGGIITSVKYFMLKPGGV